MSKTIQMCVDDSVKDSAAVTNSESDNTAIRDAIAYRKAGGKFHTASEFKARMKSAIKE